MSRFCYRIAPEIFQDHPEYCRGVAVFRKLDNTQAQPELSAMLRASEQALRERIVGNVAEHAHIAAWREAYRRFGAKPSEHRSSIEALSRRVLKPDCLPDINPLVDIGNLLSLRYLLPAGVHPIDDGAVEICLRKADAHDRFLADVNQEPEVPALGEVVLARGTKVLTRRWTWRQAADTRILPQTEFVFFDVDGLPPVHVADVERALDELAAWVQQFCGGQRVCSTVLHAQQDRLECRID